MLGKIFSNIGLTFHQMGEHIESEKNFKCALKLSPNNKKYQNKKLIEQHKLWQQPKITLQFS